MQRFTPIFVSLFAMSCTPVFAGTKIIGSGEFYYDADQEENTTFSIDVKLFPRNDRAKGQAHIHTSDRLETSARFDTDIEVNCIKSLGNGAYMISGILMPGSRTAYVNQEASDGQFSGVVDILGDQIVGKLYVDENGTARRSDWTTGQEACAGFGPYAIVAAPASIDHQAHCMDKNNFVNIPNCQDANPDDFTLDRTITAGGEGDTGSVRVIRD